jgi:hypothetical protein
MLHARLYVQRALRQDYDPATDYIPGYGIIINRAVIGN